MGCASSSPLLTSAGSEMIKSVSREASRGAVNVPVQDVAHTLEQSLDNAKETVGDTLKSIGNDFGAVLRDKMGPSEDGKTNPMEKLPLDEHTVTQEAQTTETNTKGHKMSERTLLNSKATSKAATAAVTVEATTTTVSSANSALQFDESVNVYAGIESNNDDDDSDDANIKPIVKEVPTTRSPKRAADVADCLKTSIPEPQIERILTQFQNLSKPTDSELAKLTKEAEVRHSHSSETVQRIDTEPVAIRSVEKVVEKVLEEKNAKTIKNIDAELLKKAVEEGTENESKSKAPETNESSSSLSQSPSPSPSPSPSQSQSQSQSPSSSSSVQ